MDLDKLRESIADAYEESLKDAEDILKDNEDIRDTIIKSLQEIAIDMASGKPIDEIIKDKDTESLFLASAALSTIGQKQAALANATQGFLEKVVWVILRQVIAASV